MDKATKAGLLELAAKMGIEIAAATSNKTAIVAAINARVVDIMNVNEATTTANMVLQHRIVVMEQRVRELETAPTLGGLGVLGGACVYVF